MENRLKIILPFIISPNKGGFMHGRNFLDGIIKIVCYSNLMLVTLMIE